MSENKSRDDKFFNCEQEHERQYVSGQYAERKEVYDFLIKACKDNSIHHSSHDEVYALIEEQLGYKRQSSN